MHSFALLLAVFSGTILLYNLPPGATEYYIITPNSSLDSVCPQNKTCHTLESITQSPVLFNKSGSVTLLLLEGIHIWNFMIRKIEVESLNIIGFRNHTQEVGIASVILRMNRKSTLYVKSIVSLRMENLKLEMLSINARQLGSLIMHRVKANRNILIVNMWGILKFFKHRI